ncbi:MAG: AAA family ATPase [Bacteroidales bacterium]|nr:AAA family ATPase [Bacteroidales bacterium]MDD7725407.1 AAA family ATPase [Bacteroidales bacterium]MDY4174158.1 AAA family ATPase [Bacteroidales bacterium]
MQTLFNIQNDLLSDLKPWVKRGLMDQIDWQARLIGIKGSRGIGKTTFLLNYAKMLNANKIKCLYADLNDFYFANRSIVSLADEFVKTGGHTLLLDQVYKYPEWSNELRFCYDNFPDLHIVFTGSPVMRLKEENPQLHGLVKVYSLEGFSFREYLNYSSAFNFPSLSLQDILQDHEQICRGIAQKVKPLAYFSEYLRHGFYPYFLGQENVYVDLVKTINLVLEVEISYLQQIDIKLIPKLRKLLYTIVGQTPFQPNVSKLAASVDTSRATVMNYMLYLKHARLIHLLYQVGETGSKKPAHIFMQNPNLMYLCNYGGVERSALYKTFFFNQLGYSNTVERGSLGDFCVNGGPCFLVGDDSKSKSDESTFRAREMIEVGHGKEIPLWLFGFLY